MLIDQMKEHPEEFRGYAGKFRSMLDTAYDIGQGVHRGNIMSLRDAKAILAAAETHLYEVWLAADVLTTLMQPKANEVEKSPYATSSGRGGGKSMLGSLVNQAQPPWAGTAVTSTSYPPDIDQVYRMEKEKYRMELERHRRQENEYAMRTTKPFGDF